MYVVHRIIIGVMRNQATVRNGGRESTSTSYIKPAMKRSNLHVLTMAHVLKVGLTPSLSIQLCIYKFRTCWLTSAPCLFPGSNAKSFVLETCGPFCRLASENPCQLLLFVPYLREACDYSKNCNFM